VSGRCDPRLSVDRDRGAGRGRCCRPRDRFT
jgi:hypothetical protein